MKNIYDPLYDNQLIDEPQYNFLKQVHTRKIVSLYYELRLILYLGIMLFTGGIGYLVYQNISSFGHLVLMTLLGASIYACFHFINKLAKPYSNAKVSDDHVYFDYLVLLASLLIVSLFTYILVYFEWSSAIGHTSLLSAIILFFMAYRYDNKILLSMAITALAAAVGVSFSPVDWSQGDLFEGSRLYNSSIALGAALCIAGIWTRRAEIKPHFDFTYRNFGYLLYLVGCISAIFASESPVAYAFLTFISSLAIAFTSWRYKEFLFFLYASIAGYIAITYMVFEMVDQMNDGYWLLIYYFPMSSIGYIVFLITKKSHFSHD
jgi:hypothetical protein